MIDCRYPQPDPRAYDVLLGPVVALPDRSPWAYPVYCGPGAEYAPSPPPATGSHCAGCGYRESYHGAKGECPGLKTKRFTEPGPIDRTTWREILKRDTAARLAVPVAHVPIAALPTQVPAREPHHLGEIAGYQGKQAVGLGRRAVALGWEASPWYWRAGTGAEGCAVRLRTGVMRAVATWGRARGNIGGKSGWAADVAYAWRTDVGRMPVKLTVTELEGFLE